MLEAQRQFILAGERAGQRYGLTVPRTTSANLSGGQLGQRAGSSLEFREHRDYQPGDDLRRIDWNAFARSDKLTVKLYRGEISPHVDLLLDGSRSMALAESAKWAASVGLAAALAVAADNAGYVAQAWLIGERCEPVLNGSGKPSAWGELRCDFAGNPGEAFTRVPPRFRRQGMRVLLSDLLWLGDPLVMVQQLAQGASSVVVVQVLAEADIHPPERGRVRLVDSETEEQREIFIDDAALRRYEEALARHQQNWQRACRQAGAVMVSLIAEELVANWNLAALVKADVLKV